MVAFSCGKLSSPVLGQPAEFCVELLEAPEELVFCGQVLEFAVRIKHEDSGICGFLMGLSVRDEKGNVLPSFGLSFSRDDLWEFFSRPQINRDGIRLSVPCQELMSTVPPVTAVGVLDVWTPYEYEGSFRVHFNDPILYVDLMGEIWEPPIVVFNGAGGGPITLRDSDLYSVRCPAFVRGDPNDDGDVNIADPIAILEFLFSGGDGIRCKDAADVDDSGAVSITDPIKLLNYLFSGGPPPAPPFEEAGPDPVPDELPCSGLYPGA